MAKQHTLVNLTGKVGESSYFYSRNGGFQMRKLNPNMSERVKSEPGFSNTRKNATEFGACANLAATILNGINSRWRVLLSSRCKHALIARARLVQHMDTAHPYGSRTWPKDYQELIQSCYNQNNKNLIPLFLESGIKEHCYQVVPENEMKVEEDIVADEGTVSNLAFHGATHIQFTFFAYRVNLPRITYGPGLYSKASAEFGYREIYTVQIQTSPGSDWTVLPSNGYEVPFPLHNRDEIMSGLFVAMYPQKEVNNNYYVLQKYCSSFWWGLQLLT